MGILEGIIKPIIKNKIDMSEHCTINTGPVYNGPVYNTTIHVPDKETAVEVARELQRLADQRQIHIVDETEKNETTEK